MTRIKTINSHVGHARFLAQCDLEDSGDLVILGTIPRHSEIPSPYAYSQEHVVYRYAGIPVIIVETRHKHYEVFQVSETIRPVKE